MGTVEEQARGLIGIEVGIEVDDPNLDRGSGRNLATNPGLEQVGCAVAFNIGCGLNVAEQGAEAVAVGGQHMQVRAPAVTAHSCTIEVEDGVHSVDHHAAALHAAAGILPKVGGGGANKADGLGRGGGFSIGHFGGGAEREGRSQHQKRLHHFLSRQTITLQILTA